MEDAIRGAGVRPSFALFQGRARPAHDRGRSLVNVMCLQGLPTSMLVFQELNLPSNRHGPLISA